MKLVIIGNSLVQPTHSKSEVMLFFYYKVAVLSAAEMAIFLAVFKLCMCETTTTSTTLPVRF